MLLRPSVLFPIIQVTAFIALNDIVNISGLWLNVFVFLLLCLESRMHVKNDSPKNSKAVAYDMIHFLPWK